jgi:hypothetical protein
VDFPSIYLNMGVGMGKIRKYAGAGHYLKQIYSNTRSQMNHSPTVQKSNQVPIHGI